ncbi:YolD-like family protein [Psychrobacillus sp. PGGUH221]|uniref:YolD-like family protein n=1 Tax=Psychrobacillus sp. PGGUH221 TaxID=3020058 RepID=UPI0035C71D59
MNFRTFRKEVLFILPINLKGEKFTEGYITNRTSIVYIERGFIREYVVEQKKISKPELDKWDLDIIQDNVQIAMKRNVDVEVKTRKNGEFNFQIGTISWVSLKRRTIEMEDV